MLRLIPSDENGNHGNAIRNFYAKEGGKNGKGLKYCIEFDNEPTRGTDGYTNNDLRLGSDQSKNICAQAYGVEFILVL